jgi:hypothetical protein
MTAAAALGQVSGSARHHVAESQNTVKPRLTAHRARRAVENDDFAAFARRILAAYARRVASGDVEALAQMHRARGRPGHRDRPGRDRAAASRLLVGRDRAAGRHHPPGRPAAMGRQGR